jgi:hypothetical protein
MRNKKATFPSGFLIAHCQGFQKIHRCDISARGYLLPLAYEHFENPQNYIIFEPQKSKTTNPNI